MGLNILSAIVFLPVVVGIVLLFLKDKRQIQVVAAAGAAADLVLMLVAMIVEYLAHTPNTLDILELMAKGPNDPVGMQNWVFLAFAAAFAIKVPMFPFHTWLPDAHVEAPTAGSIILAGVLLKVGSYGFLRFNMAMTPLGAQALAPLMATLAVVGILYGALAALAQSDVKRLVAYSSVSH